MLTLMAPSFILVVYCLSLGAKLNSTGTFLGEINDLYARGALSHLELSERISLALRMTTMPMPHITALGVPVTMHTLYLFIVLGGVSIGTFETVLGASDARIGETG